MVVELIAGFTRCTVVSPYANANTVLALNLALHLGSEGFRTQLCVEAPLATSIARGLAEVVRGEVLGYISLGCGAGDFDAKVYVAEECGAVDWSGRVYAFLLSGRGLSRVRIPDVVVLRVRRVGANTYSISVENSVHLFKLDGFKVVEVPIPEEALLVYRLVKEAVEMFGSPRASEVVKMLRARHGFARERALEAVRKAVAVGLVKYDGKYLTPLF